MCHRIELSERLDLDFPTLTVTDLILTKLQVVELNAKDLLDLELLMREHEFGFDGSDVIDVAYLSGLVRDDWGLWRTLTGTLDNLARHAPGVAPKAEELLKTLAEAPRSRKFQLRAKIGERKRWYKLPDEVHVGSPPSARR